AHVRRPRVDYESHAAALDRNELGALLVAAGLGPPTEHARNGLNGLRVSEATGADIEHLDLERGRRTLTITRKGGKVVTFPLAPHTARAIDLVIGERTGAPVFLAADGAAAGPARHLHRRRRYQHHGEEGERQASVPACTPSRAGRSRRPRSAGNRGDAGPTCPG
ncbi:MAG TPA: site-specific integrase, partial [Streptosporangiaceae bacterium]|nr:site-specific integrase [Streptosporangiaceae bacterium]